jgi:hypothetical protein
LVEIGSVVSEEKILLKCHPPIFLFLAWWPSWMEVRIIVYDFGRGPSMDHSIKVLLQLSKWFLKRRFVCEFPIGSYVKLSSAVGLSWSKGRTAGHIFGREPSNDYFIKNLFLLSKWFQTRRFLWEFPIGQTSRNLLRSCQSFGLTDMKILSDRNIFCRSEKKAPKYSLSCA